MVFLPLIVGLVIKGEGEYVCVCVVEDYGG